MRVLDIRRLCAGSSDAAASGRGRHHFHGGVVVVVVVVGVFYDYIGVDGVKYELRRRPYMIDTGLRCIVRISHACRAHDDDRPTMIVRIDARAGACVERSPAVRTR